MSTVIVVCVLVTYLRLLSTVSTQITNTLSTANAGMGVGVYYSDEHYQWTIHLLGGSADDTRIEIFYPQNGTFLKDSNKVLSPPFGGFPSQSYTQINDY